MASIINASTAGVGGLITTADASGILTLQTASIERARIDSSGNFLVGATSVPFGLSSSLVTTSNVRNPSYSASMSGATWVNLFTLPTTQNYSCILDVQGSENNINGYYAQWSIQWNASNGGTITGPFNAVQTGNNYGQPNLRISVGIVQIQSANGLSGGGVRAYPTYLIGL
jgi:hypothetical protein